MLLIKLNQGMILIKSNQNIQLWQMARCSIMTYGKKLNHVKYIWELYFKPKAEL